MPRSGRLGTGSGASQQSRVGKKSSVAILAQAVSAQRADKELELFSLPISVMVRSATIAMVLFLVFAIMISGINAADENKTNDTTKTNGASALFATVALPALSVRPSVRPHARPPARPPARPSVRPPGRPAARPSVRPPENDFF